MSAPPGPQMPFLRGLAVASFSPQLGFFNGFVTAEL